MDQKHHFPFLVLGKTPIDTGLNVCNTVIVAEDDDRDHHSMAKHAIPSHLRLFGAQEH